MSADFDDLVARVRAVAMDEACAALTDGRAYPTQAEIGEAETRLLSRLWSTIFITRLDEAYGASLPNSLLGDLTFRPAELGAHTVVIHSALPGITEVPSTPRDPIHDAIDAHNKPGRANE